MSAAVAVAAEVADPVLEAIRSHQQELGKWMGALGERLDRMELQSASRAAASAAEIQSIKVEMAGMRAMLEQLVRELGAEPTAPLPAGLEPAANGDDTHG